MFAVKGWSVSADKLKSETASTQQQQQNNGDSSAPQKSKKRKRAGKDKNEEVTAANVAELYGSVFDGIKPVEDKPAPNKKQKKEGQNGDVKDKKKEKKKDKKDGKKPEKHTEDPKPAAESKKEKKDKKSKKDKKDKKKDGANTQEGETSAIPPTDDIPPPLPPAPPKLTPLQASMRQKLISARFRHLNETLYTRPSAEAFTLFQDSPEMFDEYHEGFRRQVTVWPENPVDSFLSDIRTRGKVKQPHKGSGGYAPGAKQALPRTQQTCTIADLGCGDARLAEELQKDGKRMNVQVKSFDLQSPSKLVTKADIANLPLADGSVNVAIFCLALMGTNWIDFVEEAYRILHWKGELWVAEIKSRFGPIRSKHAPVTHSVGNRKKVLGKNGKAPQADEGDFEDDLAVEVDGQDDRRKETDVSAFVEVLRKRGFILQGEKNEAVDLSNKMFVKLHFIKGAAPIKGKGVKAQEQKGKPMKKWAPNRDLLEEAEDEMDANEASILKPCVYKIR